MRCDLPSCNDVWEAWEGREMRRDGVRVNAGGGRGLVPRPLCQSQHKCSNNSEIRLHEYYRKRNNTYSSVLFLMRRCQQTPVKFVAVGRTYDDRNNNAINDDTLPSWETQIRTSPSHSMNKRDT